jgi:hypothetical protein
VQRKIQTRSPNRYCRGKGNIITYSECVSAALFIQLRPSVACLAVPYCSTLPHKHHYFRENFLEHKMCVGSFTKFVSSISYSKKNLARYHKFLYVLASISTCYSCQNVIKLAFSRKKNFLKNTQIRNFTKIRPVGAELFHAHGQRERQIWQSQQWLFTILRLRLQTISFWSIKCLHYSHACYIMKYNTAEGRSKLRYKCI